MKKKYLFLFLVFSLFLVSGCAKNNLVADNQNDGQFRRPDFGQPEEQADIRGLVSDIVGNEVTILKMERPQMAEGEESQTQQDENSQERNNNQALSFRGTTGGTRGPGMGRGSFSGNRPEMNDEMRAQMLERMKANASGEETVLIPVGIRMLKPDTSGEGGSPSMLEANLEDIKKDTMITIWLDKNVTDRNIASFVMIMN